jgi:hypothetical protein
MMHYSDLDPLFVEAFKQQQKQIQDQQQQIDELKEVMKQFNNHR